MNNERYLKLKKDFIVLYLARNGIMTFLITLCSFGFDLSKYYQIKFIETIPYLFSNNIFTPKRNIIFFYIYHIKI